MKKRFFEVDHEQKWQIIDNTSAFKHNCYICAKHKYTMIFYQRESQGNLELN